MGTLEYVWWQGRVGRAARSQLDWGGRVRIDGVCSILDARMEGKATAVRQWRRAERSFCFVQCGNQGDGVWRGEIGAHTRKCWTGSSRHVLRCIVVQPMFIAFHCCATPTQSEKGEKGDKPKKKKQRTEGKDKEGGKKGKGKEKGGIAANRPRRQPGAGAEEEQAAPRRPPRTGAPGEEDEERSEDMNAGEADKAFIDDEGAFGRSDKGVC